MTKQVYSFLLLFFPFLCFSSHIPWFEIPDDWNEIIVNRSIISGVKITDEIWDLSEATVLEKDVGYRVKRFDDSTYLFKERRHRFNFKASGDTLLLTGYESRLQKVVGTGVPIFIGQKSNDIESPYEFNGEYALSHKFNDHGFISSVSSKTTIVMGEDTLSNILCIKTTKNSFNCDSVPNPMQTIESWRLYKNLSSCPILELRRGNDWEECFVVSDVLENGLTHEEYNKPLISPNPNINLNIDYQPNYIYVEFNADKEGTDIDVILCSFSGVVYWSLTTITDHIGIQQIHIPTHYIPRGNCLLIIKAGNETTKHIVTISN